jgi:hypothetical protein
MREIFKHVRIFSQDISKGGLDAKKEDSILSLMSQHNIYAYNIQGTRRRGDEIYQRNGYLVINHGKMADPTAPDGDPKGRCGNGVAIILSSEAMQAWIAAGCCILRFCGYILAVKLVVEDIFGQPVTVMLATACAPIGVAKEDVRQAFARHLDRCMESRKLHEVLQSAQTLQWAHAAMRTIKFWAHSV